jgi:metal-dependent amidase/aminoacylase/carboxypeptidase family protein
MIGAALEDGLDQTGKNLRPHHSPLFDFDERALMHGYNFFMELIRDINS